MVDFVFICGVLIINFILVINFVFDGGEVLFFDGSILQFICLEDGILDVLFFIFIGDMMVGYVYLFMDENNIIIEIIDGDSYDFDFLLEGNYWVWGLVYVGGLLVQFGDDVVVI